MDKTNFYAVIVAGGNGNRMQTATPKQFLLLNGLPIIMHTILKFSNNKYKPKIIIVIAQEHLGIWAELIKKYNFKPQFTVVCGGKERFDSVKNSLAIIQENAIVAIHDAVRPLLSDNLINNCFQSALNNKNAICAVQAKDSVRLVNGLLNKTLQRNQIYLVQTPQVFTIEQLKIAYKTCFTTEFTDDASVVENAGFEINLIEGEAQNIKITHPTDLIFAESIILSEAAKN